MRKITLNESQFRRLFESGAPTFNGGDVKEYNDGEEVSLTATVDDEDGNKRYGDPYKDIGKELTIQNFWANAQNGARTMP